MRKFIGITIGPIGDTMGEATSPGALWFASSMFSDITKRICEAIIQEFTDTVIYSPYYDKNIKLDDGIGKFHDRILFSVSDFSHEKMKNIVTQVKEETVDIFPRDEKFCNEDSKKFFIEYLQIHYVVKEEDELEKENCILELSSCLDAMELMKTFPKDDAKNPIRKLFLGEDENGNKYIKNSILFQRVTKESNQLKREGRIRNIGEIASCNETLEGNYKRKHYYALVSADGDGMGKFLKGLSNEKVTEFSKCCLAYAQKAAEIIGSYGGMTIYAGGDDLLFLAPVMTAQDDIFGLCNTIQDLFVEELIACGKFSESTTFPTISFGISIQHKKFPLYEALKNSSYLLALAKADGDFSNTDCKKNNMMIGLQKHSGQSLAIVVSNEAYKTFNTILSLGNDYIGEQKVIHSILYTLDQFSSSLGVWNSQAKKEQVSLEKYKEVWNNFFDNVEQTNAQLYIDGICEFYYSKLVMGKERIFVPSYAYRNNFVTEEKEPQTQDASLLSLIYILKFKKFLSEEEGEK
ncbi:MAG: type III-B CRISPR-associated protein Cas10/Cmr2 [Lachnospiraceae bacterium]|nr:type III-B CRISPR-associated protein Cas10/Cmr2 [Lachnospiraceae bacterium]